MNDIELAARISPEIAESLTLAKEVVEDYPGYCLATLRTLCKQVCQEIVRAKNLAVLQNGDLAVLIAKIIEQLKPDAKTKHALNTLRDSGNKGAHPESFQLNPTQWAELAHSALEQSVKALKFAHSQLHPDESLPTQIETTPIGGGLKALCYKATIEEKADAKYLIGMHFLCKAEALHKDFYDPDNRSGFRILDHKYHYALEKSRFWFKFASISLHPGAMYEYGRALAEGKEGDGLINMGIGNIQGAAARGDANANFYAGNIYYKGLHKTDIDYAEAKTHFELAAADDHPEALMALAEMHLLGKGVAKDHKSAIDYTKRSAEAGYPKAQFKMYEYYINGNSVEQNEEQAAYWLKSSSDQKFWPAMYQLAECILKGKITDKNNSDAEELFKRCIHSIDIEESFISKSMLRLASIHLLNLPTTQSISEAVHTVIGVTSRTESLTDEVKEMAWSLHERADELLQKVINEQGTETPDGHISKILLDSFVSPITNEIREARRTTLKMDSLNARSLLPPIFQNSHLGPRLIQAKRPVASTSNIGRNDRCPCGSDKKHKKCCGA